MKYCEFLFSRVPHIHIISEKLRFGYPQTLCGMEIRPRKAFEYPEIPHGTTMCKNCLRVAKVTAK